MSLSSYKLAKGINQTNQRSIERHCNHWMWQIIVLNSARKRQARYGTISICTSLYPGFSHQFQFPSFEESRRWRTHATDNRRALLHRIHNLKDSDYLGRASTRADNRLVENVGQRMVFGCRQNDGQVGYNRAFDQLIARPLLHDRWLLIEITWARAGEARNSVENCADPFCNSYIQAFIGSTAGSRVGCNMRKLI